MLTIDTPLVCFVDATAPVYGFRVQKSSSISYS